MIDNEWLMNEITALRIERIKKKQPRIFVLVLILLCAFTAAIAYDTPCHVPVKRWRASWECPNCGHDNFAEIERCGICGTKKPKKF